MSADPNAGPVRIVGRYAIYDAIASGGMATVHLGRLLGPERFSRTVAIKRLHEAYVADPDFVAMFIDEARLAARVRHPNVLQMLDLVVENGEILLVVDYVQGQTLAQLLAFAAAQHARIPHRVVASVMSGVLQGLHAAHEARDEYGRPIGLVHRDVSPQNVMIGLDGVARVLDFGVAKAEGRLQMTREGQVKGKLGYIAPEQIDDLGVTRATDIYSAGIVTWEALTGQRLFVADTPAATVARMLHTKVMPPSQLVPGLPAAYDEVVSRALLRDPAQRFGTAREMALALEACDGVESTANVSVWLERLMGAVALDLEATKSQTTRVISGVQTVDQPALDDEFDWTDLADEPLDPLDEATKTLPGEPVTTELPNARVLLDDRARSELLSASDWELTRPEGARSPDEVAAELAKPAMPAPPSMIPSPRRSGLGAIAIFALAAMALGALMYLFRDRLPWLP